MHLIKFVSVLTTIFDQMIKKIITLFSTLAISATAFAGGFVTNTNQSVAFFRMPAQEGAISIDGAYFNPAGIGFLNNGFHLGLNWESAWQTRQTTTNYAPLAFGAKNNGSASKLYKGEAFAPVIPSFDLAYVHDRWFISNHFGLTGGGGKAKYNDGLGSFESEIANIAAMFYQAGVPVSYDANMYLEGTQYTFSDQIMFGYKITDNLSVSAGVRFSYALASYNASISDITLNSVPAAAFLTAAGFGAYAALAGDKDLDCSQSGFGISPIVSVDYKIGSWNFAARYEFQTKLSLTNSTKTNTTGIAQYNDGNVLGSDIPALLAAGIGYTAFDKLHIYGAFHEYFDKSAESYNPATGNNDKQTLLSGNTMEYLGGIEFDLCKRVTLSAGAQRTVHKTGSNHEFINEMAFSTNSTSVGAGAKIAISDKLDLNIGYFKSFFDHLEKKSETSSTDFFRTSNALGAGLNISF